MHVVRHVFVPLLQRPRPGGVWLPAARLLCALLWPGAHRDVPAPGLHLPQRCLHAAHARELQPECTADVAQAGGS